MSSDFTQLCEMYGLSPGDPEAIDIIIEDCCGPGPGSDPDNEYEYYEECYYEDEDEDEDEGDVD